jgi:hypothetical protein
VNSVFHLNSYSYTIGFLTKPVVVNQTTTSFHNDLGFAAQRTGANPRERVKEDSPELLAALRRPNQGSDVAQPASGAYIVRQLDFSLTYLLSPDK